MTCEYEVRGGEKKKALERENQQLRDENSWLRDQLDRQPQSDPHSFYSPNEGANHGSAMASTEASYGLVENGPHARSPSSSLHSVNAVINQDNSLVSIALRK